MNWNLFLTIAIAAIVFVTSSLGGQLASTKSWHKWVFWGLGLFALILISVQGVRNEHSPKPLTLKDAQELLSQAMSANHQQSTAPSSTPIDDTAKPITRVEFQQMLQRLKPPSQPVEPPKLLISATSIIGLPERIVAVMLGNEGAQIVKDWYTWYDDEDEPLSMEAIKIRHTAESEDRKEIEIGRVTALSDQLRASYYAKLEGKIREINPIRAEAIRLLNGPHTPTKEDLDEKVIFEAIVAGNPSVLRSVDAVPLGRYLEE